MVAVNVFSVRPEHRQELIDCIRQTGDPYEVPGLVAIELWRSLDGRRVVNHMRWASREAFDRARAENPAIAATRERIGHLVEGTNPDMFEVVPWPHADRPPATASRRD